MSTGFEYASRVPLGDIKLEKLDKRCRKATCTYKSLGYKCSFAFCVSQSLTLEMLIMGLAVAGCMISNGTTDSLQVLDEA